MTRDELTPADSRRCASLRVRGSRDRGSAAVEFALVLLPFLTLVGALVEMGFVFYAFISASHGAHEGARFASISHTLDRDLVVTRVRETASPVRVLVEEVDPTLCTTTIGSRATVVVSHRVATPLLGLAGFESMTVRARGEERC